MRSSQRRGRRLVAALLVSAATLLSPSLLTDATAATDDPCPLASQLPIVPGDSPESIWYKPGEPPDSAPKGDDSDWVVITCNADAPGYRADINLLFGSAGSGWAKAAVRYWLANNGDSTSPVVFFSLCRQGPSQGQLVQEPPSDTRCTQP